MGIALDPYSEKKISEIEYSFQVRNKELIDFFNFIDGLEESDIVDSLHKSYILLLYANWEGFIKEISCKYFDFINSRKKKVIELSNNFYEIYFKNLLKDYTKTRNINIEKDLLEKTLDIEKNFYLKINEEHFLKYILGVNDNLRVSNYANICNLLNYSYQDKFGIFEKNLERLIHNRNSIAHTGIKAEENTYTDIEDIKEMKKYITKEMENFKNFIIENIQEQKFLNK